MIETEFAVVGGGLVGMAVAYGLQRAGRQVTVYDEGDIAWRASRGNFGLVWTQGKGVGLPPYARWSRRSAALWPALAAELRALSGVDVELDQPGGLDFFLSETEAEARVADLTGLRAALGGDYPFEYLGHNALKEMVPEVGPAVVGAVYCPADGHVNPLYLLRALVGAFRARGGRIVNGGGVQEVLQVAGGFELHADQPARAAQVVLCAGLGNTRLAPMVGLRAPLRANRGQVLVTERLGRRLRLPSAQVRQVGEGAIQIGDSHEDVGLDDRGSAEVIAAIARRALQIYPFLEHVRMVRAWAALRVMSDDGFPIYERSRQCPGAALVNCHSGVTLAAAHVLELAPWLAGDAELADVEVFSAGRFGA